MDPSGLTVRPFTPDRFGLVYVLDRDTIVRWFRIEGDELAAFRKENRQPAGITKDDAAKYTVLVYGQSLELNEAEVQADGRLECKLAENILRQGSHIQLLAAEFSVDGARQVLVTPDTAIALADAKALVTP